MRAGLPSRYQWALLSVMMLYWMSLYLSVPFLAPLMVHLGGNGTDVGLMSAAYGFPQLVCRVPLAIWADRTRNVKLFLIAGLVIDLIGVVGFLEVSQVFMLIWLRGWAGLAASFWAIYSLVYSHLRTEGQTSSAAMGWVSAANYVGQVAGMMGGGILEQTVGWVLPLKLVIVLALGAVVIMLKIPVPDMTPFEPSSRVRLQPLLSAMGWLGVMGALIQAIFFITTFGYVPLLAHQHGISEAMIGLIQSMSIIPAAIMAVVTGSWLVLRWRPSGIIQLSFILLGITAMVIPWAVHLPWRLMMVQGVMGMAHGMMAPVLMAIAIQHIPAGRRMTALAAYQSMYAVGMTLGPLAAAGLFARLGARGAIDLTVGLSGAGYIIAAYLGSRFPHLRGETLISGSQKMGP